MHLDWLWSCYLLFNAILLLFGGEEAISCYSNNEQQEHKHFNAKDAVG
jgi:hypothetical protein